MDCEAFDGCSRLMLGMNNEEKFRRLRDRFGHLPVHRACYHASTTAIDDLLVAVTSEAGIPGSRDLKDGWGMTPFHAVATSAKLRTDVLQVLLNHYPRSLLSEKDFDGKTMMDYLLVNQVPKSIDAVKLILQKTLVAKLEMWERNDGNLSSRLSTQIESMKWGSTSKAILGELENEGCWLEAEWQSAVWKRRQALREVIALFERYATIEVTSILELGLWKKSASSIATNPTNTGGDRESSRMMCGTEVVIPNVIGFLGFGVGESLGNISMLMFDYDVSWIRGSTSVG